MNVSPAQLKALKHIAAVEDANWTKTTYERIHGIPHVPTLLTIGALWTTEIGAYPTLHCLVRKGLVTYQQHHDVSSKLRRRRFGRGYNGARRVDTFHTWVALTALGRQVLAEQG